MDIVAVIEDIVSLKRGNQELAIYRWPNSSWRVAIGNTWPAVMMFETDGEFEAEADTLEEALVKLHAIVLHRSNAAGA